MMNPTDDTEETYCQGCSYDYSNHSNLNRHLNASARCRAIIRRQRADVAPPIGLLSFVPVAPLAVAAAVASPGEVASLVPAVDSPGLSVRGDPLVESPGIRVPQLQSVAPKRGRRLLMMMMMGLPA